MKAPPLRGARAVQCKVAKNGAEVAHHQQARHGGLCRDTWRCVPAGLIWRAIIDLPHGRYGWTRLMFAAEEGKLTIVRSLYDWHAGLEVRDSFGFTALHWACSNGQADCAHELIARGADVNVGTTNGYTPLMYASWHGHIDIVRQLLAAGADKRRVGNGGHTAHSLAGFGGHDAICALLDAAP